MLTALLKGLLFIGIVNYFVKRPITKPKFIMRKEIETPYVKMSLENGLITAKFSDGLEMDLRIARLCVNERLKLSEGCYYLFLIDMTGIQSISKDARDFLSNEGTRLVKAGALIVKSPVSRTVGNIFLAVNKPLVPTRLFTDETAALSWLKQYSEQESVQRAN